MTKRQLLKGDRVCKTVLDFQEDRDWAASDSKALAK